MKFIRLAFSVVILTSITMQTDASVSRIITAHDINKNSDRNTKALALEAIDYNLTTFEGMNRFYLGAAQSTMQDLSLIRVYLTTDPGETKPRLAIASLAPDTAFINVLNKATGAQSPNPLFNSTITNLALVGSYPVVTFEKEVGNPENNQRICLIQDISSGNSILTNGNTLINDAQANPTSQIIKLAGTPFIKNSNDVYVSLFFAVVAPSSGTFGQPGSGVALILKGTQSLDPVDAQTGSSPGNRAVPLDASKVQIGINPITVKSTPPACCWDARLERLFIGVEIEKNSINQETGGVALLVGRLENASLTQLILEPIVNLDRGLFSQGTEIVGFFKGFGSSALTKIHHLSTLTTTQGTTYLIINGGTSESGNVGNQVYAVPLINTTTQSNQPANMVGKMSQKNNPTLPVAHASDMTLSSDQRALVGGTALPFPPSGRIKDMFVVGNSVFVCLDGDRLTANNESGILQSTALFDAQGMIRAWTSWQRVMGSVGPVAGAGFDQVYAHYWSLTKGLGNTFNTIKVTQWGDGEDNPGLLGGSNGNPSLGLTAQLRALFPASTGGVHQLFDFDSSTAGFVPQGFSMLVATGFEKVALIETGRSRNGVFIPSTGDFSKNIGTQRGNPLQAGLIQPFELPGLGPICTSDVSRTTSGLSGWVFIGGEKGCAVLSDENGNGWDTTTGLQGGFVGLGESFSFKKIGSLMHVRKVACDGEFLYVLTHTQLLRIRMQAQKFSRTPLPLSEEVIATSLGVIGTDYDFFTDFVIVGNKALLATTNGAYTVVPNKTIQTLQNLLPGNSWIPVSTSSGLNFGSICHLFTLFDPTRTTANIFVTATDLSLDVSVIYLVDLQEAATSAIIAYNEFDYFYAPASIRSSFFTHGGIGLLTRSKHFGRTDFLKLIRMTDNPLSLRQTEQTIAITDDLVNTSNSGTVIRSSATGALIVPLNSGIKVNE